MLDTFIVIGSELRLFVVMLDESSGSVAAEVPPGTANEATNIIRGWLDKCRDLRQLDFGPYVIKHNIHSAMRGGFLPISLKNLKIENQYLYNVLTG
jgi:hypothetical protein